MATGHLVTRRVNMIHLSIVSKATPEQTPNLTSSSGKGLRVDGRGVERRRTELGGHVQGRVNDRLKS